MSQQMFPPLLQKLEEFLFCVEDNHAEVGYTNTVTAWLNVISVIKVSVTLTQGLLGWTNQLVDLNLNMTSVDFLTV